MPNSLTLTVEEPDRIRSVGMYDTSALMRLQSSATEAGAFADVTGTGSTPTVAVLAGVRSYDGYDPAGTVSTWYRTRFENVGGTRTSDWSPAFQVAPEGSGLICSLWDVKQDLGETGTTNDELILEKIRQVGGEIMSKTGRLFTRTPASGTTTYLFDVTGWSNTLCVPKGIAAASTLEVATSSQPESGGTYATVTTAEWFLRPTIADRTYGWPATEIVISDLSASRFYPGYNIVRVTMALGFDTVPYDIQGIAQRAVVGSYLSKGSGVSGVAAVGPSGAMSILRYISPADAETLTRYSVIP
jgi:hypothetical protein